MAGGTGGTERGRYYASTASYNVRGVFSRMLNGHFDDPEWVSISGA